MRRVRQDRPYTSELTDRRQSARLVACVSEMLEIRGLCGFGRRLGALGSVRDLS
jgi:hypothetical protein